MKRLFLPLGLAALSVVCVLPAEAQVPDHLKCYKIKDALHVGGTADLDTPQFGLDPGCTIMKTSLFCVPATKTNVAVTNEATGQPITPLPVGAGASGARPDDRICYKVRCPTPATSIAHQSVTDQFGNRTVSRFRASLVCTPAFKGNARFVDNGDGTVTDNYTGLQWEKKNGADGEEDPTNPHDVDNTYSLTDGTGGTANSVFLRRLNFCGGKFDGTMVLPLFAGHCDRRLPTVKELRTILTPPCPGNRFPCIDPVFGPTIPGTYWSSTHGNSGPDGNFGFRVSFQHGTVDNEFEDIPFPVRAVRGGSAD